MDGSERRKYKRLGSRFDISCVQIGSLAEQFQSGYTVNVSQGGLFFESKTDKFKPDDLLKIDISIPPTPGLLNIGGKFAGFVKVLRMDKIVNSEKGENLSSSRYGIAIEFCKSLRLII